MSLIFLIHRNLFSFRPINTDAMWKTAILLLITIVIIPFIGFRFDEPLSVSQAAVLTRLAGIYLAMGLICFIISSLTDNYSQVDKIWSIMPPVYAWIIAWSSGMEPRLILMAVLVTLWGIRLTCNFGRRGGYSIRFWSGTEDYRWSILRSKPEFSARWKWVLFNLVFISLYQMGLILLITLPALRSMEGKPLFWGDFLVGGSMLVLIVLETIADQQQWNFHRKKRMLIEQGEDLPEEYRKGFVQTGLWGLVRHPNYASEQAIWIVFYFFSVTASGQWINWSVTGAILLVLLFWGSSNFSEQISAGKYPAYSAYMKRVPRFIPFFR
jgi:steroid 5-alpha reductase family enzyme